MSFLNPLAFLFLLAVPVLILLYFLKLKRPQVRVPSTLLWQKVIEDLRVNSPFQKLKRSLLLLLQLLALLALIAALTRPLLKVRESAGENLIILLDNSASMMSLEEGKKSRLDLAKEEIKKLASRLGKRDEAMLIVFNTKARVASGFTTGKRRFREIVAGVAPTMCSSRVEPALLLAKSICNSRNNPRVLLYSDGAFAGPGRLEMPVDIEFRQVGTPRPNLAITGLDIRRSLHDRQNIEMFVAVENFSTQTFAGTMNVKLDEGTLDNKYFSVEAGDILSQIFEATLPTGGTIRVEFDAGDALACDNLAWKIIPPPTYRNILLVGQNLFFLERAFKASRGVVCATLESMNPTDEELAGYSTVIWNGVPNPKIAPCHNIYLGCLPPTEEVKKGKEINAPDVLDWDNTHPVNRFLDFDNLLISSTFALETGEDTAAVLRSTHTPLIAMFESKYGGVCIVGFDPIQSNWPLLVSFPLFLNNCLDYFEEEQAGRLDTNIAVGDAINIPGTGGAPTVQTPRGRRKTMEKGPGGQYTYADVMDCGIYSVDVPGAESYTFAVNLFDRRESLLNPVSEPPVGGKKAQAMQPLKRISKEYWKPLVLALGFILLIEWAVYHRRWFV